MDVKSYVFCSPDFAAHALSSIMDEPCEDMSADALEWLNTQHEAELEELAREHEHWNGSSDQGNHSGPFLPEMSQSSSLVSGSSPSSSSSSSEPQTPSPKRKTIDQIVAAHKETPDPKRRLRGKCTPPEPEKDTQLENKLWILRKDSSHVKFCRLSNPTKRCAFKIMHQNQRRELAAFLKTGFKCLPGGDTVHRNHAQPSSTERDRFTDLWFQDIANGKGTTDWKSQGAGIAFCLKSAVGPGDGCKEAHRQFGRTVLLTWQGPWGVLENVVPAGEVFPALPELMGMIGESAVAKELYKEFGTQVQTFQKRHGIGGYAIAQEVCTRTFEDTSVIRLHFHAWLRFDHKAPGTGRLLELKDWIFKQSMPVPSTWETANHKKAEYAGHVYLCVDEKVGKIRCDSDLVMHIDYPVNPLWICRLLSSQHISSSTAKSHFAKAVFAAKMNIENVTAAEKYNAYEKLRSDKLIVDNSLRMTQRAFRLIPAVTDWLASFGELKDRYKFLVLDGASGLGKTRLAANMTTAEKFLLVDCASSTTPDMLDFVRGRHDVVLYDEAHVDMIIKNKKLFQSGIDIAKLASSATNNCAYSVWMHRVKQIVCSNVWESELKLLPDGDRDWINKNSIYVEVTSPLWI
jgi:hypothetical protein